jgi:hypothetical protein
MICKVMIVYDGGDQMHSENVRIDPVKQAPDTKRNAADEHPD